MPVALTQITKTNVQKLQVAFDAFNVFNRQNVDEVTSVYGGGTIDFCGTPPTHFGDAASLAIQKEICA